MKEIKGFDGEYDFLSNFYEMPVRINVNIYDDEMKKDTPLANLEVVFPTSEHAFHAFKVVNDWKSIKQSEVSKFLDFVKFQTPGKAKRAGRSYPIDAERWDAVKIDVMRFVLNKKFSNVILKKKLLDTGDAYLEETNTWGDKYWGVCNGEGDNHLGKLLMEIRDNLRKSEEE